MKRTNIAVLLAFPAPTLWAQDHMSLMDGHVFAHLMVDEFELVDLSGDSEFVWDMDVSVGGDLRKAWLKTRGETSGDNADRTEIQLLYSKAILPFWDLQAGFRHDREPAPERNWAAVSLRGLTPSFFNVEAELFLAEGGQTSIRAKGEYELLLTQRLVLSPELELLTYGRDEPGRLIGSGLSEVEFDIRLRYEIKREIAPYIGLGWHRLYGATRNFATAAGQKGRETVVSIGVRGWF